MPHFSLFWKLEILFLAFSCLIVKCLVWLWEKLSCLWFVQLPEYVLSFCFCQIWRLLRCNVFEYAFMLILFSSFLKLWCYDWWYFCYGHIQIPEAPFCFLIFKKKIRNTDFSCSDWVNSTDVFSSSLILFSITSLLLFSSSNKLFLCVSDILSFSSLNST